MKKLFIFLLAISLVGSLESQTRRRTVSSQSAVSYNGATQYLSKTTPVSMDLNGSELITASNNRDFEVNIGNWLGGGNQAIERITSDFHSGVACAQITATGAGDNNANLIYCAAGPTMITGYKYTKEIWAKSVSGNASLTMAVIAQTKTVTITTGWAKYVFNFVGVTTGTLRVYLAGAGVCLIDDVSLTQAYDAMVIIKLQAQSSNFSAYRRIFELYGTGNIPKIDISGASGTQAGWVRIIDGEGGAFGSFPSTGNIATGSYVNYTVTFDHATGIICHYVNGNGNSSSSLAIGKLTGFNGFDIGKNNYWLGSIAEIQYTRFTALPSDIASIIAGISATKKPLSSYTNGTIVGWWDWKNGFQDKMGLNNLLPTGGPQIISVRY